MGALAAVDLCQPPGVISALKRLLSLSLNALDGSRVVVRFLMSPAEPVLECRVEVVEGESNHGPYPCAECQCEREEDDTGTDSDCYGRKQKSALSYHSFVLRRGRQFHLPIYFNITERCISPSELISFAFIPNTEDTKLRGILGLVSRNLKLACRHLFVKISFTYEENCYNSKHDNRSALQDTLVGSSNGGFRFDDVGLLLLHVEEFTQL